MSVKKTDWPTYRSTVRYLDAITPHKYTLSYFPEKKHRIETFRPSMATVGVSDVNAFVGANGSIVPMHNKVLQSCLLF